LISALNLIPAWEGARVKGKDVKGESTEHRAPIPSSPFQKHCPINQRPSIKTIYSEQNKSFWNRYNVAWLLRQPGSVRTLLSLAVFNIGEFRYKDI
jgi:hypothetical protein